MALRWSGCSRGSGATHENRTLMSQRVHLLPNALEIEAISREIWCQDNVLFVPLNASRSHSFKQSSRPATYSSWLTNQEPGNSIREVARVTLENLYRCKKNKTKHWTMAENSTKTVTFSGLNPCESGRRSCLVTWES